MTALTERTSAEAVRWAREAVAFDSNDADGARAAGRHAVRRARRTRIRSYEYRQALAAGPDDATLKRGLERARKKIVAEQAGPRRAQTRAPPKRRAVGRAPAEGGDDAGKTAAPSAPAEPAAGEQQ